ncbi:hypothetical protein ACH5RR_006013 [Cinchona calisaya]|uniref:Uncharacterized protein n=1 Tax=Cinchona calisaya TaxID=153742 RepID=A0ABD3AMU8_9GENT
MVSDSNDPTRGKHCRSPSDYENDTEAPSKRRKHSHLKHHRHRHCRIKKSKKNEKRNGDEGEILEEDDDGGEAKKKKENVDLLPASSFTVLLSSFGEMMVWKRRYSDTMDCCTSDFMSGKNVFRNVMGTLFPGVNSIIAERTNQIDGQLLESCNCFRLLAPAMSVRFFLRQLQSRCFLQSCLISISNVSYQDDRLSLESMQQIYTLEGDIALLLRITLKCGRSGALFLFSMDSLEHFLLGSLLQFIGLAIYPRALNPSQAFAEQPVYRKQFTLDFMSAKNVFRNVMGILLPGVNPIIAEHTSQICGQLLLKAVLLSLEVSLLVLEKDVTVSHSCHLLYQIVEDSSEDSGVPILQVILDVLEKLSKPDVNALLHEFGFQLLYELHADPLTICPAMDLLNTKNQFFLMHQGDTFVVAPVS